ncbi:MAG: AtpZ/AtpI family protein [Phycisphaeraceae bacterium]
MPQPSSRDTWRLAYVGMEFAAGPMAGGLVGYWIDSRYETDPWGLLIGALVGLGAGTYLFVKEILLIINRDQKKERKR